LFPSFNLVDILTLLITETLQSRLETVERVSNGTSTNNH
jgi:hypothetical protein